MTTIKLKLPTEEQRINNILNHYGFNEPYKFMKSPIEKMDDAVKICYHHQIYPLAEKTGANRGKYYETFCRKMIQYSLEQFGKGVGKRCNDGCKADFMFKFSEEDKWIGIQIKTATETIKKYGENRYWKFDNIDEDYSGMLMYFRCITDGNGWLIPHLHLREYYAGNHLYIPVSNTGAINWDKYRVTDKNVGEKLMEYYCKDNSKLSYVSKKVLKTPISHTNQKENRNREKTISLLSKLPLEIVKPEVEDLHYDLIFGKLKIQEKTSLLKREGYISLHFKIDGGNGIHLRYKESHFDILYIHFPDGMDDLFLFIPMIKLVEHGIIREDENGPLSIGINIEGKIDSGNEWMNEYLLNYRDPNVLHKTWTIYHMQLYNKYFPLVSNPRKMWNISVKNINDLVLKWDLHRTYIPSNLNVFLIENRRIVRRLSGFDKTRVSFKIGLCGNEKSILSLKTVDYIFSNYPFSHELYGEVFFLFPLTVLEKRGLLDGNLSFSMKDSDIEDSWIWDHAFRYDDEDFYNTLMKYFKVYDRVIKLNILK